MATVDAAHRHTKHRFCAASGEVSGPLTFGLCGFVGGNNGDPEFGDQLSENRGRNGVVSKGRGRRSGA